MKHVFVLFCLISLTTGVFAQTTVDQDPTAVTTAFFKSLLEEDGTGMSKLLADDFMIISNDGQTADKSLLMQALGGGYLVVDSGTVSNISKPRLYNGDAAVVTGNWKQKGSIQGQAYNNEVLFTAVCVKMAGGWKLANVQFSATQP